MSKYLVDQDDKPEDDAASSAPLRAADHGSLPVAIPDLTHLTTAELLSLRSYISTQTRDARKKSNQLLNKTEGLRRVWMETISAKTATPEARQEFQRQLVKHPAAFLAYSYANSLFVLDEGIRAEMNRRSR